MTRCARCNGWLVDEQEVIPEGVLKQRRCINCGNLTEVGLIRLHAPDRPDLEDRRRWDRHSRSFIVYQSISHP